MRIFSFFSQVAVATVIACIGSVSVFAAGGTGLAISPLKYEYTISQGHGIAGTVRVSNNTDTALTLYTSKEDFTAGDESGTPKFVLPQEQTNQGYSLANWVKIETDNFTLAPRETREIQFTVTVPANGEPGGHYGAIFFSPGSPNGAQVAVVQRLGVLLLVNVPGNVKIGGEMSDSAIGMVQNNTFTPQTDFTALPATFQITFKNEGNTHLKPTGKIELTDENGQTLKNIGKESIVTPAGAFIGERMVDYIPINNGGGNVLPNSSRQFLSEWDGFGYQELNADGTKSVHFKTPTEYYVAQSSEKEKYLTFWESVHTQTVNKKITANISLSYVGKDQQSQDFHATKTFTITYQEDYIGINYWMIACIVVVIAGIGYYVFVLIPKNKKKLRDEIMREMENQNK